MIQNALLFSISFLIMLLHNNYISDTPIKAYKFFCALSSLFLSLNG